MVTTDRLVRAPRRQVRRRVTRSLAGLYVGVILAFLYAPVVVTVLFSFTTSPRLSLPIEGVTLHWYTAAVQNPLFTEALFNSALLAAVAFVFATVAGVAYAFGLTRLAGRTRTAFLGFGLAPAIIPLLVIGISLTFVFQRLGLTQGVLGAALGHVLVALPFVILTMNSRLEKFDFSIIEAARDLGATGPQAFRQIVLPVVAPAVIGSGLLAIALSLDEFVVTWFNIGSHQTVPVLIWGMMRRGVDPSINALATLIIVALIVLALASSAMTRERHER